jgi:hypothetical protein
MEYLDLERHTLTVTGKGRSSGNWSPKKTVIPRSLTSTVRIYPLINKLDVNVLSYFYSVKVITNSVNSVDSVHSVDPVNSELLISHPIAILEPLGALCLISSPVSLQFPRQTTDHHTRPQAPKHFRSLQ